MRQRTEYPDAEHILLDVATVRLYAEQAKSPYVGIPIVTDGSARPAVFRRKHIVAAVGAPGHCKAVYDATARTLTLNGGRSRYVLINQITQGNYWQIVEEQRRWAHGQQRGKAARERNKTAGPMAPKARATRELIGKLERRAAKMRCERPENPVLPRAYALEPADKWERDCWREWLAQKPMRKALSLFMRGGRVKDKRTWAQFTAAVESLLGRTITPYPTLHARKGGPNWDGYWKHIPSYVGMARKPGSGSWSHDSWLYAKERRGEYCAAVRAKREIMGQIADLKGLLAIYERGLSAVEATEAEEL